MAGQSVKRFGQAFLKQLGLYHRLKTSVAYDLYWNVADSSLVEDRRREVAFYRSLLTGLRPGDVIFDVGANL
jgi:hypothetical protein